jgi:transposase
LAYGKKKPVETELRMVDLGRMPNSSDLNRLRQLSLTAKSDFASAIWPDSILDKIELGKDLDRVMLAVQASFKGSLNAVWAEKARISAKVSVVEQVKRAKKTLFGQFKHLSSLGEKPNKDGVKRLINFSEEVSLSLIDDDVVYLKAIADSLDFKGTIDFFRKIEAGTRITSLTENQQSALLSMLDRVKSRFGMPVWKTEESVVQLHLDYRTMSGGREALASLLSGLDLAAQSTDVTKRGFLIAGVVARSAPLKLDAVVRPKTLKRLLGAIPEGSKARFSSIVIEVGLIETVVKAILRQETKPFSLYEAKCLLGNDFGFVNTAAISIVQIDRPLDAAWLESVKEWTKAESKTYLQTHHHDGAAVEQFKFSGRNFLSRINEHAKHVDKLKSEIDRIYLRLNRLKHEICKLLGLENEAKIDLDVPYNDKRLSDLVSRFSKLLVSVTALKILRRKIYRSVQGLKKSWFGWVTTYIVKKCVEHKAAYVYEDLTILAKEKDSSDYRGRTFNKMIKNGSKGQFSRPMLEKTKWYGVPEIKIPSFYTSTTDVRFSVVDNKQRKGEVFKASKDGRRMDADIHASLTIALWPLLRPNLSQLITQ